MPKKNLIIFAAAVIAVATGVYFLSYNKGYKAGYGKGYDEGKEVGRAAAKTEAGAAVSNPLEKLPETNPFEKAVNPFKDLYQNPFK